MNKPAFCIIILSCFLLSACDGIITFFAFHPDTTTMLPAESLPAGVQEIYIQTDDGERLHCYWSQNHNSDKVLLYFHGNAGNLVHRLPDMLHYHQLGINVLGVDYRGYGKSTGTPNEAGLYRDGRAALQYTTDQLGFPEQSIFILGRSIGTTVAVDVSQHKKIAGLILVTPLTSGKAHAQATGFGPFAYIAGDAFDNASRISNIICPLLVIHGTHDQVIPYSMGVEIFQAAKVGKKMITIDGAGHNDLSDRQYPMYWNAIHDFMQ